MKTFCFDLDGTLANLYDVPGWLAALRNYDPSPYLAAMPMGNFSTLARKLNTVRRNGNKLVIISWCSKCSTASYDIMVAAAKRKWLAQHLPSVSWDEIYIVPYGQNKAETCGAINENWILFDDEERNRNEWKSNGGLAFTPEQILEMLK